MIDYTFTYYLQKASDYAKSNSHEYITTMHLLYIILKYDEGLRNFIKNECKNTNLNDLIKHIEVIKEVAIEKEEKPKKNKKSNKDENYQLDFTIIEKENLINSIADLDVMSLTPMDAMNTLYKLTLEAKKLK